jgi:hypothetical protein
MCQLVGREEGGHGPPMAVGTTGCEATSKMGKASVSRRDYWLSEGHEVGFHHARRCGQQNNWSAAIGCRSKFFAVNHLAAMSGGQS